MQIEKDINKTYGIMSYMKIYDIISYFARKKYRSAKYDCISIIEKYDIRRRC
jgi:hypothetical protein